MSTSHESKKSPENGKKAHNPRRLFSLDSMRSATSNTSRRSAASELDESVLRGQRSINPFELPNVQEKEDEHVEDPFNSYETGAESWIPGAPQVMSPTSPPVAGPPLDKSYSSNRLEPVRPPSLDSSKNNSAQYANFPTNRLWDNLRQHVLTPPARPTSPPSSIASPASTTHTGRTTTPKPSRLAKLGFRHVVEGARVIQDDTRRFGDEILRACAIARNGDPHKASKDPSMTSLNSNATSGQMANGAKRLDYLRRPMSVTSLSIQNVFQAGSGASLRHIHQTLVYYADIVGDKNASQHLSANLPHESRVLSTLLCPFLTPSKYPMSRIEEEQMNAVDAFELLLKSWIPLDEVCFLVCARPMSRLLTNSVCSR